MALRKPLFVVALVLILIVVLIEIGAAVVGTLDVAPVGRAIPYLAILDGMLLYVVALMGGALLIPEAFHARAQGIITLVLAILALLGIIVMILTSLLLFALMVGLLVAVPFGPAVYAALGYATFPTGSATTTLSVLMLLKIVFAGFLLFAHQRFLQNKTLVLLIATSLLANIIISFLHAFPPRFIVSVTDVVAAIIIAVLAAIWGILFLVGGIVSVVKLLRIDRAV